MCGGGSSRTLRHNTIRDIIAKAARNVGFTTDLEHGGGLGDQRRPGDVIIYNWREGKDLQIDVAVTNPLCSSNINSLISDGVGGAATAYGSGKEKTYWDLDFNKYEFLPFIVETTGGLSKEAWSFCREIKKRHESLNCHGSVDCYDKYDTNPLRSAINIELQRANSRMILERTPSLENLIESAMVKCELAASEKKDEAIETLRLERLRPTRIIKNRNWGTKIKDSGQYSKRGVIGWKGTKVSRKFRGKKRKTKILPKGGGKIQSGDEVAWKPVNIQKPQPLNPKPPWEDKKDNVESPRLESGVMMDWDCEAEERILANKLNTSRNPSTFVCSESVSITSNSLENKETKSWKLNKDLKSHTDYKIQLDSYKIGSEGKDTEKVHWQPPCAQNM